MKMLNEDKNNINLQWVAEQHKMNRAHIQEITEIAKK